MGECYSIDEIRALVNGEISIVEGGLKILSHINQCPACQNKLESISREMEFFCQKKIRIVDPKTIFRAGGLPDEIGLDITKIFPLDFGPTPK